MAQPAVRRSPKRDQISPLTVVQGHTWDDAVDDFLAECRRKNCTGATLENYEWYLRGTRTSTFVKDHDIAGPWGMTAEMLEAFEGELFAAEGGLAAGTVATFHRIIKNFLRFSIRKGYGPDAEVLDVQGPRLPQREPETYTDKEIAAMRAAVKARPRDLMLIDLMLATGLRLQEVANLTVRDLIETPNGPVLRVVQGKGRKDRAVPMDTPKNRLSPRLMRFIAGRPANSPIFLSMRAGDSGKPLTADAIQTLFKRLAREVPGIHIHPHKFRHTFATRALAAGLSVAALQRALGHSTMNMTMRYVHFETDDLLDAFSNRRD